MRRKDPQTITFKILGWRQCHAFL